MAKRKGRRVNATGRNDGEGQYANLSYEFLRSPAWRSLSGAAVKVWLELRSRYNGSNNGKLTLSLDEAARSLHLSKGTACRALAELVTKGFLVMTKRGQWYGRMASQWRVTDKSFDGHPATCDWKRWQPPKKQSLGTLAEHIDIATGPPEYRRQKICSTTVPVRGQSAPSIGTVVDR